MRVSTNLIFQRGLDAMQRQQSQLLGTQQKLSDGKRVLTPADDPVAASRAVETSQAQAINAQYGANQSAALNTLALSESTMGGIGDALRSARTLLVNAGSGALTDADRRSIALDLRSLRDQVFALANSRDGAGGYLFSGYRETVMPFTPTATGAIYNGDQGQRELQVAAGRNMPVTANGTEIFERIRQGNGTFVTSSNAANTGLGMISVGQTVGAVTVPVDTYQIQFNVVAGVTTYDVVNVTTATTLSTGNAYVDGAAISFNGLQVEIKGAPADNDAFDIAPSANQNVFSMLTDAINLVETGLATPQDHAALSEGLGRSLANMDQAIDNVLSVRAEMGSHMRELDVLKGVVEDRGLYYKERMSELVDLDYAAAISDFTREQVALEAAQKSYQSIVKLSLFNYL